MPNLARLARKWGFAVVIHGKGVRMITSVVRTCNAVPIHRFGIMFNIADLSAFYGLLFCAVIEQKTWLPLRPEAIFFR